MSLAVSAPPDRIRVLRAPQLDPPCADDAAPRLEAPVLQPASPPPRTAVPQRPPARQLSEGKAAASRFLRLVIELFNGFRIPSQLHPLLVPGQAIRLQHELTKASRHFTALRRVHPGHGSVRRDSNVHICEPRPGTVEATATLHRGDRSWAMPFRLELRSGRWRCTELTVIQGGGQSRIG